MTKISALCVYCGSKEGTKPQYKFMASELGALLARRGIKLVYGGGDVGLMGAVALSCHENGGEVIGVIPEFLMASEAPGFSYKNYAEIIITKTMHERKHRLFEQAQAFVALPGGLGTLEELSEVLTWAQLQQHNKPVILFNVNGYWDYLLKLLNHMQEEGFLYNLQDLKPIIVNDIKEMETLLESISA